MRHRRHGRHLGRTSSHRAALRRNLACSLFVHGRVTTTPEKAKEVRGFVEKLITLARVDTLANFRRALALLDDKFVVKKLFKEVAPNYRERPGGYTRILKLDASANRLGDNAPQVIFELVGEAEGEHEAGEEERKKKTVRERLRRFGRQSKEADHGEAAPEPGVETPDEPAEETADEPQSAADAEGEAQPQEEKAEGAKEAD